MSKPRALPAELTIYGLAALRHELLSSLPKPSKSRRAAAKEPAAWPLVSAAVMEVDAAGVQLLLSLSHALHARQRQLVLHDPSPALVAACERLGLTGLLGGADAQGATT